MNRAQAPALAVLLAACAWAPACGLNQAGVTPPDDTIAFPASAVMDGGGNWLFVTNSNADLRYNDGTLMTFSLTRLAADRNAANAAAWGDCPRVSYPNPRSDDEHFCCWNVLDRDVLDCDERHYIGSDAGVLAGVPSDERGLSNVRIGSFAAGMVRQRRVCPSVATTDCPRPDPAKPDVVISKCEVPVCEDLCKDTRDAAGQPTQPDRLLINVRGDTSLTYVDVAPPSDPTTPPSLRCSGQPDPFAVCDDDFRVNKTGSAIAGPTGEDDPPDITIPDEPYALAIDETSGLLFIGHLTGNSARPYTGGFSLFDVMPIGDAPLEQPRLIGPFSSPFTPNSLGAVGVSAMKFLNGNAVYASSRYVPQVAPLAVTGVCPQPGGKIREIAAFPNGTYYTSPLTGTETRGIEFVGRPEDNRAFVLQRTPPALIGFYGSTPTDILETCGSPTFLDKHDNGAGERLFVTCFADGEIYVFDPSVPRIVKTFLVGRGPAGLVFDDTVVDGQKRNVAYSVNFGDNDIAVIDLLPGSPTEYHVIQRLGFPRTSPR